MSLVHIDASPKQLSKLRNGHKIRIKPPMKGEGFNLMVDPSRYNAISRCFQKKKGITIQLTPEEILANRQLTPEYHMNIKKENSTMSGKGIFGKTFDNLVEKTIGKRAKDVIYNSADMLKPTLKAGIDKIASYAPEIASSALSGLALATGQPELVPFALMAGHELGKYVGRKGANTAKDYLDKPTEYQENISNFVSNIGGSRANRATTLAGQMAQDEMLSQLNQRLGTNMGNISRANILNAIANRQTANMMPVPMQPKSFNEMPDSFARSKMSPELTRGYGLKKTMGIVGTNRSQLNQQATQAPALQSQPAGANFQFGSTLPPAYQKFHKGIGSGLGCGLYA
jgi:hypothetical protein